MTRRRKFLLSVLGLAGLAGLGLWGFGRGAIESEIVSVLRRRLGYLKLDEEGLHAFARDQTTKILTKRMSMSRVRYHLVATVGPTFKRFQRSTDTRSRTERIEDMFVSTFLLSSDFFTHGSDESRVVRYVAYYDALLHPCSSPFARPAFDGAAPRANS